MKVIFLDIDGVLNVYSHNHDRFGSQFHKHLVDNLRWVIEETGAKIVISSTWRKSGEDIMKEMWQERDLPGEVIGITPVLYKYDEDGKYIDSEPRGKEIQQWLIKHPKVKNYVILDDDSDMLKSQKNNFVMTSRNISHPDCVDIGYGLTKISAERAIRILNSSDDAMDKSLSLNKRFVEDLTATELNEFMKEFDDYETDKYE